MPNLVPYAQDNPLDQVFQEQMAYEQSVRDMQAMANAFQAAEAAPQVAQAPQAPIQQALQSPQPEPQGPQPAPQGPRPMPQVSPMPFNMPQLPNDGVVRTEAAGRENLAYQEKQRARSVPFGRITVGMAQDIAANLSHLGPEGASQVLSQLSGLSIPGMIERQKALAQFNHDLRALDRALTRTALQDQRDIQNRQGQDRIDIQRDRTKGSSIPFAQADKKMRALVDAGLPPQVAKQVAQSWGYDIAGTQPEGGVMGMGKTEYPILVPRQNQRAQGSTPAAGGAAPGARVVVEKDGQRASLPVGQLGEAQKQGYKLVQ